MAYRPRVPDVPAGNPALCGRGGVCQTRRGQLLVARPEASERRTSPSGRAMSLRIAVARAWVADLLRDSVHTVRQHDLTLAAAGLTFYAGIAVVPSLLLAVRL